MLTSADAELLRYLADGRFHSGQDLAAALGLSRTAVWKHLHKLKGSGLAIDSVTGKGYRLAHPLEWLDREAILKALDIPSDCPQPVLEIHSCLPSTNRYLLQNAHQHDCAHTCLAETQTDGKGRLGRRWVSPFGCNVYLSLLWRFQDGRAAAGLSLGVGVAVVHALRESGFPDLQLKWPNDILWQGRKLGGILIEAISEYQGESLVVIGLGLNLWLSPKAVTAIDQPCVDACTILGFLPSRNLIVARVLSHLIGLLSDYETLGLAPRLADWRQFDCVLGHQVTVNQGDQTYLAIAVDVTEEGLLLLEDDTGRHRIMGAGEVKIHVNGGAGNESAHR